MSDSGAATLHIENIDARFITNLYNTTDTHIIEFYATLLRPRSRGYIKLKSNKLDKAPEIVPNYFDDPRDLQVLVRYITRTFAITNA